MNSVEYKHSLKRLLAFLGIALGTYILFLQLVTLIGLYSSKVKTTASAVSQEDVPIPTIITCWPTDDHTNNNFRPMYRLWFNLFDATIEYAYLWKGSDWTRHSLKYLYDALVIYPRQRLAACVIGNSYSCMNKQGASHEWRDELKRGESCSVLTTTMKVPYGQSVTVAVEFDHYMYMDWKLQDARYSFSQYTNKHTYNQVIEKRSLEFTVNKHMAVKENEHPCSKEGDVVKCEVNCIEQYLKQGSSYCVMPWMKSSGPQCDNATSVIMMIEREELAIKVPCNCPPPCDTFQYIPKYSEDNTVSHEHKTVLTFDNRHGVTYTEEHYVYPLAALIACCGGCVSLYSTLSLLWVLQKLVLHLVHLMKLTMCRYKGSRIDSIRKTSMALVALSCASLFLYQAFYVVEKLINSKSWVRAERLNIHSAPLPVLMLCNNGKTVQSSVEGYPLDLPTPPRMYMTKCLIGEEDCMVDSGASFIWSVRYLVRYTCNLMSFNEITGPKQITIETTDEYSAYRTRVFLIDENIIPKYGLFDQEVTDSRIGIDTASKLMYDIKSVTHLPPCIDHYQECRNRCWETHFLKHNVCAPFHMHPSLKDKQCNDQRQLGELRDFSIKYPIETMECHCLQPCAELVVSTKIIEDLVTETGSKSYIDVSLVPLSYTRESEEWEVPYTSAIAQITGLLGIITGVSFAHLASLLLSGFKRLVKIPSCDDTDAVSVLSVIWYLLSYGLFVHQAYLCSTYYLETPVLVKERFEYNTPPSLPEFTICMKEDRFAYNDKGVLTVYDPLTFQRKIVDLNEGTYEWHWNYYSYIFSDHLSECSIFGVSCLNKTSDLHEWKPVSHVNRYCSRLQTKSVSVNDYFSNEIKFKYTSDFQMSLSTINEETITEMQEMFDEVKYGIRGRKTYYELHSIKNELLERRPGDCNNQRGYSRYMCLIQCLNDYILKTKGCYHPWKGNVTGFDMCHTPSDYDLTSSLNASLLPNCECPTACRHTHYNLELLHDDLIIATYAEIIIIVKSGGLSKTETLAYTCSMFLADLGILMFCFTGLRIYTVFFKVVLFLRVSYEVCRRYIISAKNTIVSVNFS